MPARIEPSQAAVAQQQAQQAWVLRGTQQGYRRTVPVWFRGVHSSGVMNSEKLKFYYHIPQPGWSGLRWLSLKKLPAGTIAVAECGATRASQAVGRWHGACSDRSGGRC